MRPIQRSEVTLVFRLLVVYLLNLVAISASPKLPVGQIVENVVCARDGRQSYALYIPSDYRSTRKWPILFALDPAARGTVPVLAFEAAAERYGYILVGSNNSQNGPVVVGFNALGAMWEDVTDLLSIDPRRVYLTGFSGGARMAGDFAQMGKSVAGLVACGAGFELQEKDRTIGFTFVGVSGTWDMNYLELKNVTATLLKRKASSRLITFDGGHQWPPSETCVEAVEWLELASFRRGLRAVNRQLADDLFRREADRAERLESDGNLIEAYVTYLGLQADFRGLSEIEGIERSISRLRNDKKLAAAAKRLERVEKKESQYVRKLLGKFLAEDRFEALGWWRKQVEEINQLEDSHRLMAKRLLEFVWRNGFEKSWFAEKDENFERAIYLAKVALIVKPEDPYLNYSLARLQALDHQMDAALASLRTAIASGYSNRGRIREDPAFTSLLTDAGFRQILDEIGDPEPVSGSR